MVVQQPSEQMRQFFGLAWSQINYFAKRLADEGELRGLLGPRELPRLWSRHLLNSAAIVPFLPTQGRIADLGSGAGLPGLVVAMMCPELQVHLIEPMARRIDWLGEVAEDIGLDNVVLHQLQAHEVEDSFDAVCARAVANLAKLVVWSGPLLKPGAPLVALKGRQANTEVADANKAIKKAGFAAVNVHEVVVMPGEEPTFVVVLPHKK